MISRNVVPLGSSYTPGLTTWPLTQNKRLPPFFSLPNFAYHSAPLLMMGGTQAMVSTLLITVGQPNNPITAGNGGLRRGKPFLPSRDSKSAVSSPQIYAPAPG